MLKTEKRYNIDDVVWVVDWVNIGKTCSACDGSGELKGCDGEMYLCHNCGRTGRTGFTASRVAKIKIDEIVEDRDGISYDGYVSKYMFATEEEANAENDRRNKAE